MCGTEMAAEDGVKALEDAKELDSEKDTQVAELRQIEEDKREEERAREDAEENLRHERLRAELDELDREEDELKKKLADLGKKGEEKKKDPTNKEQERSPSTPSKRPGAKPTSRDKKMFGLLLGTLQRAKKDWSQFSSSTVQRKRSEAESRAHEREEEERRALMEKYKRIREERMRKQSELQKLREKKKALAALYAEELKYRNSIEIADKYLKTKAEPRLLWKPRIHTSKTQKALEQGRAEVVGDAEDKLKELQTTITKCRQEVEESREILNDIRRGDFEKKDKRAAADKNGKKTDGPDGSPKAQANGDTGAKEKEEGVGNRKDRGTEPLKRRRASADGEEETKKAHERTLRPEQEDGKLDAKESKFKRRRVAEEAGDAQKSPVEEDAKLVDELGIASANDNPFSSHDAEDELPQSTGGSLNEDARGEQDGAPVPLDANQPAADISNPEVEGLRDADGDVSMGASGSAAPDAKDADAGDDAAEPDSSRPAEPAELKESEKEEPKDGKASTTRKVSAKRASKERAAKRETGQSRTDHEMDDAPAEHARGIGTDAAEAAVGAVASAEKTTAADAEGGGDERATPEDTGGGGLQKGRPRGARVRADAMKSDAAEELDAGEGVDKSAGGKSAEVENSGKADPVVVTRRAAEPNPNPVREAPDDGPAATAEESTDAPVNGASKTNEVERATVDASSTAEGATPAELEPGQPSRDAVVSSADAVAEEKKRDTPGYQGHEGTEARNADAKQRKRRPAQTESATGQAETERSASARTADAPDKSMHNLEDKSDKAGQPASVDKDREEAAEPDAEAKSSTKGGDEVAEPEAEVKSSAKGGDEAARPDAEQSSGSKGGEEPAGPDADQNSGPKGGKEPARPDAEKSAVVEASTEAENGEKHGEAKTSKYADIESWTVKTLRAELTRLGVKNSRLKKKELIAEIRRIEAADAD